MITSFIGPRSFNKHWREYSITSLYKTKTNLVLQAAVTNSAEQLPRPQDSPTGFIAEGATEEEIYAALKSSRTQRA